MRRLLAVLILMAVALSFAHSEQALAKGGSESERFTGKGASGHWATDNRVEFGTYVYVAVLDGDFSAQGQVTNEQRLEAKVRRALHPRPEAELHEARLRERGDCRTGLGWEQ